MPDAPFDSTNIGVRERPLSGDQNQQASQIYRTIRELARFLLSPRASSASSVMSSSSGFIGDGFRAVPSSPAAMTVQVNAGMGFRYDAVDVVSGIGTPDLNQVNDLSPFKPMSLLAPITFAVPAAPSAPNSRIDIIEIRNSRRLTDALTRRQLDIGTESYLDHVFRKTLSYGIDGQTGVVTSPAASTAALGYKIGVAGNPGAVPATTAGYTKIAEISVPNGTTTITGNGIVDRRALLGIGGVVDAAIQFRLNWNAGSPIATVLDVVAPPGIDIAVDTKNLGTLFLEGQCLVFLFGGEIAHVNALAVAAPKVYQITPTVVNIQPRLLGPAPPGVYLETWTAAHQASTAFFTPAPVIGVGQKCVALDLRIWDGITAPVFPDPSTDDVILNVMFRLRY